MGNPMAHFFYPRSGFLFFISFLLISSLASAESLREFHERKCKEGNSDSCERATDMLEGERHAERIVELGDQFSVQVDRALMEEENKPY